MRVPSSVRLLTQVITLILIWRIFIFSFITYGLLSLLIWWTPLQCLFVLVLLLRAIDSLFTFRCTVTPYAKAAQTFSIHELHTVHSGVVILKPSGRPHGLRGSGTVKPTGCWWSREAYGGMSPPLVCDQPPPRPKICPWDSILLVSNLLYCVNFCLQPVKKSMNIYCFQRKHIPFLLRNQQFNSHNGDCGRFYLLGYNWVYSGENNRRSEERILVSVGCEPDTGNLDHCQNH
jgi:hypothetical protein